MMFLAANLLISFSISGFNLSLSVISIGADFKLARDVAVRASGIDLLFTSTTFSELVQPFFDISTAVLYLLLPAIIFSPLTLFLDVMAFITGLVDSSPPIFFISTRESFISTNDSPGLELDLYILYPTTSFSMFIVDF